MKETILLHSHTGLGDQLAINGLVRSFFLENYGKIFIAIDSIANKKSLEHLYSDLNGRVTLVPIEMQNDFGQTSAYELSRQLKCRIFKLGFKWLWYSNTGIKFPGDPDAYIKYAGGKNSVFNDKVEYAWPDPKYSYPRKFYSYVDQPYINRYKFNRVPRYDEINMELYNSLHIKERYILVHNKTSVWVYDNLNLPLDRRIIYLDNATDDIFDWLPVIHNAEEIHCVESSLFHLVDNLALSNIKSKLFFHDIRRFGGTQNPNCGENNNIWNIIEYEERFPPEDFLINKFG